jgi:hypothetical protein
MPHTCCASLAALLAFLPISRAQPPSPSPWDGGARVAMPWPPPPSSIAVVALVTLGLCVMLGVVGYDAYQMRQAAVLREEEERRQNVLSPARRRSLAEAFGFGGQSHFRQGAVKIDRRLQQRK